jgi:ubiquinone/menaquinone biosynthesis C-methylase UbiE
MDSVRAPAPVAPLAPLALEESRDFRSYHSFLRAARNYMEGPLVAAMHASYEKAIAASGAAAPQSAPEAEAILDDLTEFQLYAWYFRNLQRFKYSRPDLGIFAAVHAQRARLAPPLAAAAASGSAGPDLELDPNLKLPDYFRYVPFHQHTGGVAHDELDGLVYEIGRRTTVASHGDPNGIYRLLFDSLPKDRSYARVLDWGTGHGAALITWQELHPESECFGVDLSAPCLTLAHQRARERGLRLRLSQQDLEHLNFEDGYFDLVFFNFMLHELPPSNTRALLAEARRVLKPGGLFAGHEFHLRPGDPFQNALQRSHAWLNNEVYAAPWYSTPIGEIARDVGFTRVRIEPFERLIRSVPRAASGRGGAPISASHWNLYIFEA